MVDIWLMVIYSWFTHWKWWLSIAFVCLPEGTQIDGIILYYIHYNTKYPLVIYPKYRNNSI